MFSKACEYGIKASLFIAKQSQNDKRVSLKKISSAIDSPEAFTAKILQQLARQGILQSMKGPTGGFSIDKDRLSQIKVSEIVAAIDGDAIFMGCGLGLPECNDNRPCPMHHKFVKVREELRQLLQNTSLQELSDGLNSGLTFLKR